MGTIGDACLEIDTILKQEPSCPANTYIKINHLICDIIRIHDEKVGYVDDILKDVYLDVATNFDASQLADKDVIVAAVAAEFREKVHNRIS